MCCPKCRFSLKKLKQMQEDHTEFPTAGGQSNLWIYEINEKTIRMKRRTGKITHKLSIAVLTHVHDLVHSGKINLNPREIDELKINGKKKTCRWGNYITGLLKYLGCTGKISKQGNPVDPLKHPLILPVRRTNMNKIFKDLVDGLEGKFRALLTMRPVIANEVPNDTPVGGIYLFSEGPTHLYVGRTKRSIAVRIRNHFSTAPDCPFAWLLAREATARKATYTPDGSRKKLLEDPAFKAEYERAKDRIRKMNVRYVHEPDPVRQALLKIYVALAAEAKYNDFNTH